MSPRCSFSRAAQARWVLQLCATPRRAAAHRPHRPPQFIRVHACGGRNAGRHKKSFQRLPGTDGAPPARPAALSASELRTALVASPPLASAAQRPLHALPVAAAPPAKASRAPLPHTAAPAPELDPWSRVFRRAAGVEAVDDVSDAEEPPEEEPIEPPAAAELPTPVAPPTTALAKQPPRADAALTRTSAGKAAPPPRAAEPALPSAPLTEADLETALQAERETQRRVLVSRCMRTECRAALTQRRAPCNHVGEHGHRLRRSASCGAPCSHACIFKRLRRRW